MMAQRLRHRIEVARLVVTQDGAGAKAESFTPYISDEPAEIYGLSGSEYAKASSEYGVVTHRITMRRQDDVKASDRVTDQDGQAYNIRAVLPDFKQRQWLTLMCDSGSNNG